MEKIQVTIKVFIPAGEKCEGCRFLNYVENASCYVCSLWNEWELGQGGYTEAVRSEDCYKCIECRDASNLTNG